MILPPQHGGQLHQAAVDYDIPLSDWLDLSTGINPHPWQPGDIPLYVWQRLPDSYEGLQQAANAYYGHSCLPVPGSQWLIQSLPRLLSSNRVWVPRMGYEEHSYQWGSQGHSVLYYHDLPHPQELEAGDIVVVINPNNPLATYTDPVDLLHLSAHLKAQHGWLLVDEAFMDLTPQESLLDSLKEKPFPDNLIVMRSVGKFFGLAGVRLGFAFGSDAIQREWQRHIGPWAVNHPAAWLGEQMLRDQRWQDQARSRVRANEQALMQCLSQHFSIQDLQSVGLFVSLELDDQRATQLQHHCAQQGVLIRRFPGWNRVRFGLADAAGISRLNSLLVEFSD